MKKIYLFFFTICFALVSVGQKNYSAADGRHYEYDSSVGAADFENGNLYLKSATAEDNELDTIMVGTHSSPYSMARTRGYYFQAQSSFIIRKIMSAEETNPSAAMQSVVVVSFGETEPAYWTLPHSPHTTLFSAIGAPAGWIDCNTVIEEGNFYGIIGAKHDVGSSIMDNSYGNPVTVDIEGFPTPLIKLAYQGSMADGVPPSESFGAEAGFPIGRIHIITASIPDCPESIVVENDPGICGAIVNYTPPTSEVITVTQIDDSGLTSGDLFPVGTTIQQYQLEIGGEILDTCVFEITVNDEEAPVITCPDDIEVYNDPGETCAVINFSDYVSAGDIEDNCETLTIVYDPPSGTCFPIGTTEVTLTATDASGNTSACTFNVTVEDIPNLPPVIVTAAEVYVWEGDSVTLDASETWDPDGDRLDFTWKQYYSAFRDVVELINPNDPQVSFIAPEVDKLTLMPIRLKVSDGQEKSELIIKVYVKDKLNIAPLAHAGEDFEVNEREPGMLDGTASSDVDGNPLTYLWSSDYLALDDVTSATPAFVAPEVHADTAVWVSLVVNDGVVDSEPDSVQVTIKQVNRMPVADAGIDVTVNEGEQITFDGSASYDPDGDALTYSWSAEGLTITDSDQVMASLTAPEVEEDTTIPVVLVVNDGEMDSDPDTIWVTIRRVNKMPVWVEVPEGNAFVGSEFSTTIKVTDPDEQDVLTISADDLPDWLVISDHGDGTATISTDSVPRLESLLGTHTFTLKASDGTATIDTLMTLNISIKTGIDDWQLSRISVYPNPTNGQVHLDFDRLPAVGTLLQVYNQLGQTIAIRQIDEQNSVIDLSAHPSGMYYIKVNSEGKTQTEKIILR